MGSKNKRMPECCPPPVERLAAYVSKKWTLSLIMAVGTNRKMRFNALLDHLEYVSAKILSARLAELEKAGLLKRTVLAGKPPGVEYELTPEGKKLYDAIVPLMAWAERCC
jgi:DNA-binding HxlR family transcriptional regulator